MKKKPASKSAFFNQRVLIGFSFCLLGLVLALTLLSGIATLCGTTLSDALIAWLDPRTRHAA